MKATPEQTEMMLDILKNIDKCEVKEVDESIQVAYRGMSMYFTIQEVECVRVYLGYPANVLLDVWSDDVRQLLEDWRDRQEQERNNVKSKLADGFLTGFKELQGGLLDS